MALANNNTAPQVTGEQPPEARRSHALTLGVAIVMLIVGVGFSSFVWFDFSGIGWISEAGAEAFAPTASLLALACIVIALTAVIAVAIGLDVKIDWKQKSIGESSVQAAGAAAILLVIFGGLYFLIERANDRLANSESAVEAARAPLLATIGKLETEKTSVDAALAQTSGKLRRLETEHANLKGKHDTLADIAKRLDDFNRFVMKGPGKLELGLAVFCQDHYYRTPEERAAMPGLMASDKVERYESDPPPHNVFRFNIERSKPTQIFLARQSRIHPGSSPDHDAILEFDLRKPDESHVNIFLRRDFTPCDEPLLRVSGTVSGSANIGGNFDVLDSAAKPGFIPLR